MQVLQRAAASSASGVSRVPLASPVATAADTHLGEDAEVGFGLPGTFGVDYQFIDEAGVDVYVDENKVGPS